MKRDTRGVHFHNALWASAFSGLAATANFWWWETIDQLNYYPHYQPLAAFIRDIPWHREPLAPRTLETLHGSRALLWLSPQSAHGWVSNPEATWWKVVEEGSTPSPKVEDQLKLSSLAPGPCVVEWYNTWDSSPLSARTDLTVPDSGELNLTLPAYRSDLALRVTRP
jgi:hypothetical protein